MLFSLLALFGLPGCDSNGTKREVSSEVFFAPVPLPVEASTGRNPVTGEERVEVVVDRIDILSLINPGKLVSELATIDAETSIIGKIEDTVYVLYESLSSSLIEYDLANPVNPLSLGRDRVSLAQEFSTSKAKITTVTNLNGEWIFGYETTSSSLFVMRRVGQDELEVKVLANRRSIQQQLQKQTFNFIRAFEVGNRVTRNAQGEPVKISEVLLISSEGSLDDIHLFLVKEEGGEIEGGFRVFDENRTPYFGFTDGDPVDPKPIIPENSQIPRRDQFGDPVLFAGLIPYEQIREVTGTFDIDIFDFEPIAVRNPGSPGRDIDLPRFVILYEKSSSLFLLVEVVRETNPTYRDFGEIIGSQVTKFSDDGEILTAIRQGSAAFPGDVVELSFDVSFYHPNRPVILTFEEETNTMIALDYTGMGESFVSFGDDRFGERVDIFSSSTNLLKRRDQQGGLDDDLTPSEPEFFISASDVRENRFIFDRGSDDILSLNYATGLYVVVIKQGDIGRATGSPGVSDLTFLQPVNDRDILVMDSQANALMIVRIEYAAFPVRS